MIMTSNKINPFFGLPAPVTELTLEQDLKMRTIRDALESDAVRKEDIITVFLALQKQNFVLGNSLTNLVNQWQERQTQWDQRTTEEVLLNLGILFETRDSTTISET